MKCNKKNAITQRKHKHKRYVTVSISMAHAYNNTIVCVIFIFIIFNTQIVCENVKYKDNQTIGCRMCCSIVYQKCCECHSKLNLRPHAGYGFAVSSSIHYYMYIRFHYYYSIQHTSLYACGVGKHSSKLYTG